VAWLFYRRRGGVPPPAYRIPERPDYS
jgi:hypothetical protein